MSFNRNINNLVYGFNNPLQKLPPQFIDADRNPDSTDRARLGTMWINTSNNTYYILTSAGNWTSQGSGSSSVATLTITGGAGTVLTVEPSGNTLLGGQLLVNGATELQGTLSVSGAATFTSQFDVDSNSLVDIQSTSNTYPAIRIQTDGGPSEGLFIVNQQGEGNHAGGDPAVVIAAIAGGVDVTAGKEIFIQSTSSSTNAIVLSASAGAIRLTAASSVSSTSATTTTINSTGNWSASSQALLSLNSVGNMSLVSTSNNTNSIVIGANAGSQERVTIVSNLGEGTGSETTAAIALVAAAGGIVAVAEKQVIIGANASGSDAIKILADVSTASNSLNIVSTLGGITLTAGTSIAINPATNFTSTIGGVLTLTSVGVANVAGDAGLLLECLTNNISLTTAGDISVNATNDFIVNATQDIALIATSGPASLSSGVSVSISANSTGMITLQPRTVSTTALSSTNNAMIGKTLLTNQTAVVNTAISVVISNSNILITSAVLISAGTYSPTASGAAMTVRGVVVAAGSVSFDLLNGSVGNLIVTDVINIAFQVL